jgi:hypothetical protein
MIQIPGTGRAVVVGWQNGGDQVQVSTILAEPVTGDDPDAYGLVDQLRKDGEDFNGFHADLDRRRAVNDLIRLLQRARDGAFGRDA